jgi:hypothetical protein
MPKTDLTHRRITPFKKRSQSCYENKKRRMTKWYNGLVKRHQEIDGKDKPKEPLKPLSYFLDKIKAPK